MVKLSKKSKSKPQAGLIPQTVYNITNNFYVQEPKAVMLDLEDRLNITKDTLQDLSRFSPDDVKRKHYKKALNTLNYEFKTLFSS